MIGYGLALVRSFAELAVCETAPRRMAAGTALGVWIGLVPKDNLLAMGLGMLLLSLNVDMGAAMLAAAVTMWAAVPLSPLLDELGGALLTWETLAPFWTRLANLPVVPWTSFNNTLVLGGFAAGLALLYPVYRLSRPAYERFVPKLRKIIKKYELLAWLKRLEQAVNWKRRWVRARGAMARS
ncbi:MAG TPA: TIGR03546 family protein, partial [Pirellulales bacterium]